MSGSDPLDLPIFGGDDRSGGGRRRSSFAYGEDRPGAGPTRAAEVVEEQPAARARLHTVPVGSAAAVESVTSIRPAGMEPVVPAAGLVDWTLVGSYRSEVARRLADRRGETNWTPEEQEQEGWAVIRQILDEDDGEKLATSAQPRSLAEREALGQALFDSVFRLGRLQPLVDDPRIENILIPRFDRVWVEWSDGTMHKMPPVADSDEELALWLEFLAGRAENPRTFTQSQPSLHMTLPGGQRLAAARDTAWTSVMIRRHRVREVTLDQLVSWGGTSPTVASLLSAAVKARLSIVVSGGQGDGKTTFLRALCAEIDPFDVIGTFETEYELFLHELPEDRHAVVYAWEVRGGSSEESVSGRAAGSRQTAEQIFDSFRFRLDRAILGEVRGGEVWLMIKLMESGAGSMSTTHAASAQQAIDKLISNAMEAGAQPQVAAWKLAQTVHLVVQLACEVVRDPDDPSKARKHRYVAEIAEVVPGENEAGYATNVVFRRRPGQCAVAAMPPDRLMEQLVAHGFDVDAFTDEIEANRQQPRRL